ncbi:hypothetical protein [Nonomuraea sp. NPDC003709]
MPLELHGWTFRQAQGLGAVVGQAVVAPQPPLLCLFAVERDLALGREPD